MTMTETPGRYVPASVTASVLGFVLLGLTLLVTGLAGDGQAVGSGFARTVSGTFVLFATVGLFIGRRGARTMLCFLYPWFLFTLAAVLQEGDPAGTALTMGAVAVAGLVATVLMFVPSANAYIRARSS
jgi:hypothetical protein